jgi:hypothetical protein
MIGIAINVIRDFLADNVKGDVKVYVDVNDTLHIIIVHSGITFRFTAGMVSALLYRSTPPVHFANECLLKYRAFILHQFVKIK